VLVGGIMCFAKKSPYSFTAVELSCSGEKTIILIIGLFVFIVHFVLGFIVRLFNFEINQHEDELFSAYSGIYSACQFALISILIVIGIVCRSIPLFISIIGTLFFLFLITYPIFIQPYFQWKGNAICASFFSVPFVFHFFSIFTTFIPVDIIWVAVIFYLILAGSVVGGVIFTYKITKTFCKKKWVIDVNDLIPLIPCKKNSQSKKKNNKPIEKEAISPTNEDSTSTVPSTNIPKSSSPQLYVSPIPPQKSPLGLVVHTSSQESTKYLANDEIDLLPESFSPPSPISTLSPALKPQKIVKQDMKSPPSPILATPALNKPTDNKKKKNVTEIKKEKKYIRPLRHCGEVLDGIRLEIMLAVVLFFYFIFFFFL
jgi:hypothetical protein